MAEWIEGLQSALRGEYRLRIELQQDYSPSYRIGYSVGENSIDEALDEHICWEIENE